MVVREGSWRHEAAAIAALFLLLLCLIPPDGVLSGNEENYFQLALNSVAAAPALPETAAFDSSHHRFVADHLLGWLIAGLGYGKAQIVARLAAAIAFALALNALFRRFGLDALDGVIVVIVFALLGQTLFGEEWLFYSAEAKVAAYVLVLAGFAVVIGGGSLNRAVLFFAAATYFHFLVGGFWCVAALLLRLVEHRRALRSAAAAAGRFALLVAPLIAWIAWSRLGTEAAAIPSGLPPADVIYSILRLPHHTAPFVDAHRFLLRWLPGVLLAGGMLAACCVLQRLPELGRLRPLALWLALLLLYLALAFAAAAADRDTGALGKFYLFRPAALILLLWLCLVAAALSRLELRHAMALRLIALALLGPAFLLGAATRVAKDAAEAKDGAHAELIAALARETPPGSVVLIDRALEPRFLDVERRSGRATLVLWKFVPATDAEIVEWYRRVQFRNAVFAEGCADATAYRFDFLLAAPKHAVTLAARCGAPVASTASWVLLRRS
jgi:hypothetical protein